MATLAALKRNNNIQTTDQIKAKSYEQQQEEYTQFLSFLGIELGNGLDDLQLYETNLPGTACIRVARSMSDLNAHEPRLQSIAEELEAPVIHALPLDSFGATTHLPGIGPIPVFRIYGGSLFSGWGLSGHHITPAPVQIIRREASRPMPLNKRPYTQFLKQALEWKHSLTSKEGTTALVEAAVKSPELVGMACSMQLSLGRGTAQGIFNFSNTSELSGEVVPCFEANDWTLSDLGRAVAEETSMRRRAMSFVHAALVDALDVPIDCVVPEPVGQEIRNKILQARASLSAAQESHQHK